MAMGGRGWSTFTEGGGHEDALTNWGEMGNDDFDVFAVAETHHKVSLVHSKHLD